ncbi:N-acetylglutamate synthase, GNAT family [Haladaptatus litoreus]|uniref:N-acetylglutamate synthase, GNAT family n=2 Tax=Haladaptatus litoreus TaxID=553468 RepID=A0A1N7E1K7_9EURY|nr:N-acetylglutamate synthase, GNAT family [Haladaptatus litoreus]
MNGMEIRPANEGDFGAIRRIAHRAWDEAYDDILDEDTITETVSSWYSNESLSDALDKPGTAFLVAVTDDELVGFCHAVFYEDEGDVLRLYVDPDDWGNGVGTALHERLRENFHDFNTKRMNAMVLADNDIGNEFYQRMGFEKTDEASVKLGGREYAENVYTYAF